MGEKLARSHSAWGLALALTLWGIAPKAFADFLWLGSTPLPPPTEKSFVAPNELELHLAEPIWDLAKEGLYVAVGTERGFIGASRVERSSGLLLLDYDPKVVRFNRINIALLQMSRSRNDYLALRETADFSVWHSRLDRVEPTLRELISEGALYFFRSELKDSGFLRLKQRRDTYLADDEMFRRIQILAQRGRIEAHAFDLDATRAQVNLTLSLHQLVDAIEVKGDQIGVIDLSNAWWDRYVSAPGLGQTLDAFGTVSAPHALLLLTDFPEGRSHFAYFAFRMSTVRSFGAGESFARRLQGESAQSSIRCTALLNPPRKTLFNRNPKPILDPSF